LLEQASALFVAQQGVHKSADISSVIGIDWQGLPDTMLSLQWFQSYLAKYTEDLVRPRQNNVISLLYKQTFENEVWALDLLALHGFDQHDGSAQAKISYALDSDIQIWLASDVFYGGQQGLFGQFKKTDRITLGFKWGF
jgi:hypothetical protein